MLRKIALWLFCISFVGIFVARIVRGDVDTVVFVFVIFTVVFFVLKDWALQRELDSIRKEQGSRRIHRL